ncbi:MAG: hypothetical protein C4288_02180 [Leptolyngbya sp. ERB_1_1]
MKPRNFFLISLAFLTLVARAGHKATAQSSPDQSNPPAQSNPVQSNPAQSSPDWLKRIGKSYQGEFWKNGKVVNGSTLFYLSEQTGLTGMYITSQDGNLISGDLTECQVKQERTIHCFWREPNQSGGFSSGDFNATFSPDFLSFKGTESMKGDTKEYVWQGSRQPSSAAVVP